MSHADYLNAAAANYRNALDALEREEIRAQMVSTGGGCLAIAGDLTDDPDGPRFLLTIAEPLPFDRVPHPDDCLDEGFNLWHLGIYPTPDDELAGEGMLLILEQDYRLPSQDPAMAEAVGAAIDRWVGENLPLPLKEDALEAARDAFWEALADAYPRTLISYMGTTPRTEYTIAEMWVALREDTDREPEEFEVMRAMEREFERMTGDVLSIDTAEDYLEYAERRRHGEC